MGVMMDKKVLGRERSFWSAFDLRRGLLRNGRSGCGYLWIWSYGLARAL
jgi:hypothetical protein